MILLKLRLGTGYYKPVYVPEKPVVAGPNGLVSNGELLVADTVQGLEVIVSVQTYRNGENELYAEIGNLRERLHTEYNYVYC